MPAYGTLSTPPALYPGDQYKLINNAAVDANVTQTERVALAQVGGQAPVVEIVNTTNQPAVVKVSYDDVIGDFQALSDSDTNIAISVAAGATGKFECPGPLLLCTFVTAPTSGSLVICR